MLNLSIIFLGKDNSRLIGNKKKRYSARQSKVYDMMPHMPLLFMMEKMGPKCKVDED